MESRGKIFLGVIPFTDFGCGRAELGVMVLEQFFFFLLKYLGLLWPKDNGFFCLNFSSALIMVC
jgi:hypothetical protein